ncbi:hypothetical protein Bca4012_000885 [Brassica carinata]
MFNMLPYLLLVPKVLVWSENKENDGRLGSVNGYCVHPCIFHVVGVGYPSPPRKVLTMMKLLLIVSTFKVRL